MTQIQAVDVAEIMMLEKEMGVEVRGRVRGQQALLGVLSDAWFGATFWKMLKNVFCVINRPILYASMLYF